MKSIQVLLFMFLVSCYGYSQHKIVEVNYVFKIVTESSEEFIHHTKLLANEDISLYGPVDPKTSDSAISHKHLIYRNSKADQIIMQSAIFNKDFYISEKDLSSKMQWSFLPDSEKTILGYKCKGAKLSFRGRNYTAYYAEDLLFSSGPFKFYGLPGLILELHTDDFRFHFVAEKLRLRNDLTELQNPYADVDTPQLLTFKEYKDLFLKKLKELQKKMQSEEKDDTEYTVNDQSIELYD